MRVRRLLWLIALVAFAFPPAFGGTASAAMHGQTAMAAMADCPDHAPPPDPCPAQGTAKHAAGDCCPMMSSALALLPDAIDADARPAVHGIVVSLRASLSGLLFTQDPPPPRA